MSTDAYVTPLSSEAGHPLESDLEFASPAEARRFLNQWSGVLTTRPQERMLSEASPWAGSALRRALECSAAAVGLIVMLPIVGLSALLVRVDSEGPILFRQKRMGRNGKEFTLYKFRSMRVSDGRWTPVTAARDSRITRAGAFLRRYKLDELPQLWNVVRGDMSLVGPRPKLPHLEPLHMTYRPGITGAATLVFRNEEELLAGVPEYQIETFYETYVKPAKARLDFDYMRTASFKSDFRLLWRTIFGCLFLNGDPLITPEEAIQRCVSAPDSADNLEMSAASIH